MVSATNAVVLLDFGEVTTRRHDVMQAIDTKRWLQAYTYHHLPEDIQSYYRERLNRTLTTETLHTNWNSIAAPLPIQE